MERLEKQCTVLSIMAVLSVIILSLTACEKRYPLIEQKCGTCHSAKIVYQKHYTEERWKQLIHGMKVAGLKITPEEEKQIREILLRDFSTH